jgi:RNA polymerase-binding protein DksA
MVVLAAEKTTTIKAPPKSGIKPASKPATKAATAQTGPVKVTPAKAATAKTGPAKVTPAKAAPAKTGPAKVTPAKSASAKSVPAKSVPAKTASAKTVPAKSVPAKTVPVKSVSAKSVPSKAAPAKSAKAAAPAARGAKANGTTAAIVVPTGSDWTPAELAQVRGELLAELAEMRLEYDTVMNDLSDRQHSGADGAGDDQADVGSKTFEREQELSIAANRLDLISQTQHAIERLDAGTYGLCESCGRPIPKARLMAFPMATLDVACKQREERR